MRYTGPKAKICRRFGTNIFGADKYDRTLQRKPQPPGKGPRDRLGRKSQYAQQLTEKQKMRHTYGISERQFRNIYQAAADKKGAVTGDTMKQLLERRLDNVIFRAGLAMTRMQARQFVSHGLFSVNDQRVTVPSYTVKEGEKIQVRTRSKQSSIFAEIVATHEKYVAPEWLKVNPADLSIEIVTLPDPESAEQAFDVQQVIEYYSRN